MEKYLFGFKACSEHESAKTKKKTKKKGFISSGVQSTSKSGLFDAGGKYFGRRLDPFNVGSIPKFILDLFDHIIAHHGHVQSIFRREGSKRLIDDVMDILDDPEEEEALDSEEIVEGLENDPHSIAAIIKLYLMELPEPILKHRLYLQWKGCVRQNPQEMKKKICSALMKVDKTSVAFMKHLCKFLYTLSSNSKYNQMNSEELSIVFAPFVVRPQFLDMKSFSGDEAKMVCNLIRFFIENFEEIFKEF